MRARDQTLDLWRIARSLKHFAGPSAARRGSNRRLPPLIFVTDPERTPEPERIAARLPRGSAVLYRAFGAPDAIAIGRRLKAIARARGLVLLVGVMIFAFWNDLERIFSR